MLRIPADARGGAVSPLSLPTIPSLQISVVDPAAVASSALRWRRRWRISAGALGVVVSPLSLLRPSSRIWAGAHDDAAWWSSLPVHPRPPISAGGLVVEAWPSLLRRHPRSPISAVGLVVAASRLERLVPSRISVGAHDDAVW